MSDRANEVTSADSAVLPRFAFLALRRATAEFWRLVS